MSSHAVTSGESFLLKKSRRTWMFPSGQPRQWSRVRNKNILATHVKKPGLRPEPGTWDLLWHKRTQVVRTLLGGEAHEGAPSSLFPGSKIRCLASHTQTN